MITITTNDNYGYSDHNDDVDKEEYSEEEDLDDGTHNYGVIMTHSFNIEDEDMYNSLNSDLDEDDTPPCVLCLSKSVVNYI